MPPPQHQRPGQQQPNRQAQQQQPSAATEIPDDVSQSAGKGPHAQAQPGQAGGRGVWVQLAADVMQGTFNATIDALRLSREDAAQVLAMLSDSQGTGE